jgi:hypothetical protein
MDMPGSGHAFFIVNIEVREVSCIVANLRGYVECSDPCRNTPWAAVDKVLQGNILTVTWVPRSNLNSMFPTDDDLIEHSHDPNAETVF